MIFGYETEEIKTINNDYKNLLSTLKPNDILVIESLSILGDSINKIVNEWNRLTKELGIKIIIQNNELLNNPYNDIPLSYYFMEALEELLKETKLKTKNKQLAGMKTAKEKGIKLGRPFFIKPDNINDILDKYLNHKINNIKASDALGVSRATFFRLAKERREELEGEKNE